MAEPIIHTIDLHYLGIPQSIAAFLVVGDGGPVLIETGPSSTLAALERGVQAVGFGLADIRHALVTHIHLDHAGAAGHLAKHGTRIWVHELGAPHLVDPSKLIQSATRIYKEQMNRLWGPILPVPGHQVAVVRDGDVIEVNGLRFEANATPGHAKHHHSYMMGDICFAGDAAGICVPGVAEPPTGRFVAIPTPPPEFEPDAWLASIDRLRARRFGALHLTHYGVRRNVDAHLRRLAEVIDETAAWIRHQHRDGLDRQTILAKYVEWQRREATADGLSSKDFARYVSTNLLSMNVDGMLRYAAKADAMPATDSRASRSS